MKKIIKPSDMFLAIPPGETVVAELNARGQTIEDFASFSGLSLDSAKSLLSSEEVITAEIASKLGEFFGGSPTFWQRLEAQYREALAAGKSPELPQRNFGGNIPLRVPKSLHQRIVRR